MKTRMFRSFRRRRQAEMQQIKAALLHKEFSYLDLEPKRLLVRLLQNHNLSEKAKKNTVLTFRHLLNSAKAIEIITSRKIR